MPNNEKPKPEWSLLRCKTTFNSSVVMMMMMVFLRVVFYDVVVVVVFYLIFIFLSFSYICLVEIGLNFSLLNFYCSFSPFYIFVIAILNREQGRVEIKWMGVWNTKQITLLRSLFFGQLLSFFHVCCFLHSMTFPGQNECFARFLFLLEKETLLAAGKDRWQRMMTKVFSDVFFPFFLSFLRES